MTSTEGTGIYSPAFLNVTGVNGSIPVSGLYKEYSDGPYLLRTYLAFYLISVAYPNGYGVSPVLYPIYSSGTSPIISWDANTVAANPFIVELYLVNTNSPNPNESATMGTLADFFKLDTTYALPAGFSPFFNLGIATTESTDVGTYAGSGTTTGGTYVEVNENSGTTSTPIISSGSYSNPEEQGFVYGEEEDFSFTYLFSLTNEDVEINLYTLDPNTIVPITQATINVTSTITPPHNQLQLTFTDPGTASSFKLYPISTYGNPMDFKLFLGSEEIVKATPMIWDDLVQGVNSKNLGFLMVDPTAQANNVSGIYKDTITITITTVT